MSYFIKSFEDKIYNEMILWRYMPKKSFRFLIDQGCLYLPTAYSYEKSDFNEGRFNKSYVSVLERFIQQYELEDTSLEEEVNTHLSDLMAARESSFISCWTTREYEDKQMWETFGEKFEGVLLKSNVSKVYEQFDSYCDQNTYHQKMGQIIYDRQNMGKYLSYDLLQDEHWSLFFLDGGASSFEHEKEIRFILYDPMELGDVRDELLQGDAAQDLIANDLRNRFVTRASGNENRVLEVPFDLNKGVFEVIFGKNMPNSDRQKFESDLSAMNFDNHSISTI